MWHQRRRGLRHAFGAGPFSPSRTICVSDLNNSACRANQLLTGRETVPDNAEAELLAQARAGERDAFARLQAGIEPQVKRFVRRLIGTCHAEEDIVRNAILGFYMNLD